MTREYPVKTDYGTGIILSGIIAAVLCFFIMDAPVLISILLTGIGFYIFKRLSTYSLNRIVISDEQGALSVISKNLLGKSLIETQSLKDIDFTYKKRTVNGGFGSVPQIQRKNVCVIDCPWKTLVVLEPDNDGWTDQSILILVRHLASLGVKRVTEKYNDEEVEI